MPHGGDDACQVRHIVPASVDGSPKEAISHITSTVNASVQASAMSALTRRDVQSQDDLPVRVCAFPHGPDTTLTGAWSA